MLFRLYLYAFLVLLGLSVIAFVLATIWLLVWIIIRLGIWAWIRMVDIRVRH